MGESRKRKSLWDMEDETKHLSGMTEFNSSTGKENHSSFDSGRRDRFSASGIASAPKSRDHSGRPNWESLEGKTVAPIVDSFFKNRQDIAKAKEIGRGKSYNKNLSPGFDVADWRKRDHTPEYDWSGSGRYLGRGRSRSRSSSRSRSGRRGRSRSRDKARDRGRGRSRSRSRSRSRGDGSVRGQTRSRTPIRDHRQSSGWGDGSRHEKLSRTCRDFATGRCRRGSQCRFLHPDTINCSDRDRVEDDRAENLRNRPELGHISGHSNDRGPGTQSRNDVYDLYFEEDEQFRNQSRNAFPCRDFMKGNCRWGDTCRFSHHEASGDSYGKGARDSFFSRDIEQQANKNVKPSCKFFAAGKCNRDNCRFSHEGPKLNNLEGRPGEDTSSLSLDDKSKWWNESWDDSVKVSDKVMSTGWTETVVANMNIVGETAIGRTDDRLDHSLENKSRTWGIPKQNNNYLKRDQQLSLIGGSGSHDVDMGMTVSMGKESIADKQEINFHDSELPNEDGISHAYGRNTMQEGHSLAIKTSQQNVFSDSHIQQHHQGPVEDNDVNLFGSDALEVNGSGNAKHPLLLPGLIFNQNDESLFPGDSSFPNETDRNQHVLIDLNGPQQHKISPSRLQSQTQNLQNAVKKPDMSELQAPQFVSNAVANEQAAQMTKSPVGKTGEQGAPVINSSAFMAQRFVNEEQPGLDTSISTRSVPSYADTTYFVPLINKMNSNPATSSLDLLDSIGNGKADIESNHNLASATVSDSVEQKNQMPVERSSLLSTVDHVFGSSTVKHSPKAKEPKINSNPEVNEGSQTVEESKGGQENKHPENVGGHGKVDEGSAMKYDKGMRLFKNALVEFVKEILKPTWKEGRMSREVHKTIVKKVVEKVTSTIQDDHIPKAQNKVEQYLTASKPKITKLVQAYLERSLKTES